MTHSVSIENTQNIEHLDIKLRPGVTLLRGPRADVAKATADHQQAMEAREYAQQQLHAARDFYNTAAATAEAAAAKLAAETQRQTEWDQFNQKRCD